MCTVFGVCFAGLNVNEAREREARAQLYDLVKQKHINVVLSQERHGDVSDAAGWEKE